jgi:hypothetical protein
MENRPFMPTVPTELDPETLAKLAELADQRGVSAEKVLHDIIDNYLLRAKGMLN